MGFLDLIRGRKATPETRDHNLQELTSELEALMTNGPTASGVKVSEANALTISAVYAAVQVIAESVAQLPLNLYRRLEGGGKEPALQHPLFQILRNRPNPEMTPFEFWQFILASTLINGNGYAQIQRTNGGDVANLWPLKADQVIITRITNGEREGQLFYTLNSADKPRGFFQEEILHLRGLSRDGVYGISPVAESRETLGLTKAMETFDARYFGNGAMPSVVLTHPQKLTPENKKNILEAWDEAHRGTNKAWKPSIASGGADVKVIGFNPEDSQLLESRKFQIQEIARIFKIPPHKLGDETQSSFSNIEQQELNFLGQCLQPWIVRIEQVVWRDLIVDDVSLYAEFMLDSLLRADIATRNASFVAGINNGWFNQDDVRAKLNMNPLPDGQGETYYRPMNLTPLGEEPEPEPIVPPVIPVIPDEDDDPEEDEDTEEVSERQTLVTEERNLYLVAVTHRPMFATVARELLAVEVPAVRAAFGAEDPISVIDAFYDNHNELVEGKIAAAMGIYGEEVRKLSSEGMGEVNVDLLIGKFVQAAAVRWIGSSKGQIHKLARDNPGNAQQAVQARLQNWLDDRPDKFAIRETVQASGAVAKETFQTLGFKKIRWNTRGTGPAELDGKEVPIGTNFVEKGDDINGVVANTGISHPPFAPGDESFIEPVEG